MGGKKEDLRALLLAETRRQLAEKGFGALTMREVAAKCGVAVGTMYNYFSSKEMLTGCVVLESWQTVYEKMETCVRQASSLDEGLSSVYRLMEGFVAAWRPLFSSDLRGFRAEYAYPDRHTVLLGQLEALVRRLNERYCGLSDPFSVTFVAECILHFTVEGYACDQVGPMLLMLMQK